MFRLLRYLCLSLLLALASPLCAEQLSARITPAVRAVSKALPWVVNIGSEKYTQVDDPYADFFSNFFGKHYNVAKEYYPLGSGVIISEKGLIITNYHVVRRAGTVLVRLWDGQQFVASIVGFDQPNDLCLLKLQGDFQAKPLNAATMAKANDLYLGETVITIGNPFGLEHSVSQGVLSAFNRSFTEGDISFSDILQTDAAINPGNSGGPLVNLDGELIGLNLAIRDDAQGIGFAVPLARIELFLAYWLLPSHFTDTYLGLEEANIPEIAYRNGLVLPALIPGSPLDKAGLKEGDTVASINGQPLQRPIDFSRAVWQWRAGERSEWQTHDGRRVTVVAETLPDDLLIRCRLGLDLQKLTPSILLAIGIKDNLKGLVISDVLPQPLFSMQKHIWREHVKRGDLILMYDGQPVTSPAELATMLRKTSSGQIGEMRVVSLNHAERTFLYVSVPVFLN